jgi:tetratricopeptide (TPR) repeat protein
MTENIRLQNLCDCTVQIRHSQTDHIVGTGVAVSMDGKIVTCAHVVEGALGVHPRQAYAEGAEVGVYFPQAREGERARRAKVAACFPQHDDDVVLLQLTGGPSPLAPEQIAVLGKAEDSCFHPFRSYGYRRLEDYVAGWADGEIQDCVEPPQGRKVQAEPVQLKSDQINRGMSGAAVLDTERNLVVGLVSETWFPDLSTKDRDTAWAVNARVLTFDPLNLPVQDEPYPLDAAPKPRADPAAVHAAVGPKERIAWNNAPPKLAEWVGRDHLLQSIAALKYMSGDRIDPRTLPSANAKAHFIAAMLATGRYLFILDGLEVMQHQEGDSDAYGLLKSADLREFLGYFAALAHASFCLVTSRAPLLDLMAYTTYTHHDVDRLSAVDGRDLLRKLGVQGADAQLDRLVADWDGHALTLSLLGGLLAEQYGGDVAHVADFPAPIAGEPRYERVHRVLRRYDEHLTESERTFLKLFSAFRTPVHESAFDRVFRPLLPSPSGRPPDGGRWAGGEGDAAFNAMVARLVKYRILRHDAHENTYTTHPLIRAHYFALLTQGDPSQTQAAHERIKDYYLSIAGDTPQYPTLDGLRPLIEVVHHACRAGAYDEAWGVYWERIQQERSGVLVHQLGAWETDVAVLSEFFLNGDTSQDPQVSDPKHKSWILNAVGLRLMNLGRLSEAPPFFERYVQGNIAAQDWHNASIGYRNLAGLYAHLGELAKSAQAAQQALDLARRAGNKQDEVNSMGFQAWAVHLLGDRETASEIYLQAEALQREIQPTLRYHYSTDGKHADHLRRTGQADYARRVTEANLAGWVRDYKWPADDSRCRRTLGDLDTDAGQHESAHQHYDTALKIARNISHRPSLIEALLARGRFFARHATDPKGFQNPSGLDDLNEALGYALAGGYRIYEADIRIALAWAHLAAANSPRPVGEGPGERERELETARAEAERARAMSEAMGYYWGKVDAEQVLSAIVG